MNILLPFIFLVVNLLSFSSQTDTITNFQSLHDGATLVTETFEFGFFTPGNNNNSTKKRYLGIWFRNVSVKTVVWVANRDNPIKDNFGILSVRENLVLLSKNGTTQHWSTNITTTRRSSRGSSSIIAQLLSTGNLVLRYEDDNDNFLWQSFDYPTDTILPGMKLGVNITSGYNRFLTAWKNWDDPSSGKLTYGFTKSDNPEQELANGSSSMLVYRSGIWNSLRFSGTAKSKHRLPSFVVDFVTNWEEYYFTYKPRNQSLISRIVVNQTNYALQRLTWSEGKWNLYLNVPRDKCDVYNHCGSFGICNMTGEIAACECLSGFTARGKGCVGSERWRCREENNDGFMKYQNLKIPDTRKAWIDRSMTLEKCKERCWENCSCTAYANTDIYGDGSGCILWFGDLFDMRVLPDSGQDLYVRVAASVTGNQDAKQDTKHGSRKRVAVVVTTSVVSSIIAFLLVFMLFCWRRKTKSEDEASIVNSKVKININEREDLELPSFDFSTITLATNDFSNDKKLGEGGFGPVYKGTLPDGQDIAVKRLSDSSTQGILEFKNEVIFCSKLQHRNLVKVLGFCIEEREKLLIYEYMPNKSLDYFLFDSSRSKFLDWSKRFNIINGIVRGLLYLHQDSRLRVIHRDLKASNVLLDNEMNPKISDFGMARMCRGDQIEGNTSKVVGTYGYMSPEYAIDGIFSIKSDVYSFGVLLLEIISGKKNKGLSYSNHSYNLIAHAWRLWKENIQIEFIDTSFEGSYVQYEALRCIHIGLLCVQHRPDDRPTMTTVLVMLTSDSTLPQPKEPIFLTENVSPEEEYAFDQKVYSSANEVSFSVLDPR